jgi:hypothetical protein
MVAGSTHTLAASSPQSGAAGTRYAFVNWTSGGNPVSQSFTVPATATTYTGNFTTQYLLSRSATPANAGTVTANPSSTDGYYNSGTSVQITATPNSGYVFTGFSGSLAGTTNPQSLSMTAPRTVTASFAAPVSVTITTNPAGRSYTVDGTGYSGLQVFPWLPGSIHTIATTTPQTLTNTRYLFQSWSDGGAMSHTITTPASSSSLTANFTTQYRLTTAASPANGGAMIAAPSSADGYYNSGTSVQVTASPNAGYYFNGFAGDLTGLTNPQLLPISGPKNLTGNFLTVPVTTVTTNPAGLSFTADGTAYSSAQTFAWIPGSTHTISTTTPQSTVGTRYIFASWSDSGSISHTVTVPASSTSYIANFTTQYLLSAAASPADGGTITLLPASADGYYNSGTSVQVTAAASTGFQFSDFTGDLAGTTNPQSLVMSAPMDVTANFSDITGVTVRTNPAGLTFTVDGTTYTTSKAFSWVVGSTHTISTTTPQSATGIRYQFSSWSDGGAFSHDVTAPANATTFTVNFTTQYLLSVASAPAGGGTITLAPVSTDGYYTRGTSVQVTGTANSGYQFSRFSGDLTGSANPQSVVMSAPRRVTANFSALSNVTVGTNPAGLSFNVDGTTYTGSRVFSWVVGSPHTIAAVTPQGPAGTRYEYASWSDGGAVSHQIVTPDADAEFTANFTTHYLLTTASSPAGGGAIAISPASADGYYDAGISVQLTATANGGYQFSGFSGGLTGSTNPQSVVMSKPQNITANFSALSGITITTDPADLSFTVDGTTYTKAQVFSWVTGSTHTVATNTPQSAVGTRYKFASWSDGGTLSHTITVNENAATLTASFTTQYLLSAASSPSGGGTVALKPASADGYYDSGTSVQLTATANAGYQFSAFSGDLAGATNPQSVVVSEPLTVTANFTAVSGITVGTNPPGLTFNVDGTTYTVNQVFTWLVGSTHVIGTTTQTASGTRYLFANWSDGGEISHNVTATSTTGSFIASFTPQVQLTRTAVPPVGGVITAMPATADGYYDLGTAVELTAVPNSGYSFVNWGGDLAGSKNPGVVILSAPRTVTANFGPVPISISSLNPSKMAAGSDDFLLTVNGSGFMAGQSVIFWNGVPQVSNVLSSTQITASIDSVRISFPGTAKVAVGTPGAPTSNTLPFTIDNPTIPTPTILRMTPIATVVGGPEFDLQVYGSDFLPNSQIRWNGTNRFTVFLSSKQLRATITSMDIAAPGQNFVSVSNNGVVSGSVAFQVSSPAPVLSSIDPPAVASGSASFTLSVQGINFVSGATVTWNGAALPTAFVSNTRLNAAIPAGNVANTGTYQIAVVNTAGSISGTKQFSVIALPPNSPTISGLDPQYIAAGGPAFTLTVYGSGFGPNSTVVWAGQSKVTRYVSPGELKADILQNDIAVAGNYYIFVNNPASFGDAANSIESAGDGQIGISTVTTPVPLVTRVSPASVPAGGGDLHLTIEGFGFVKDTTYVQWNNRRALAGFVSSRQITADIPASDLSTEGTFSLSVSNPPPGGGTADSYTFTITPKTAAVAQLYYPRLMTSAVTNATQNTGIAIANLSGNDAAITIRAFGKDGKELAGPKITNPVTLSISGVEQRAITDSQVFGYGVVEQQAIGWMKVESSESKIAGFFLVFDDNLQTLDGADVSSTMMRSFVLPEIEESGFNQVHIANPGTSAATVNFELYSAGGTVRTTASRMINPNGALAEFITELFPGITVSASDYVRVSSNQGLVPFSYLGVPGRDAKGLNGQDASKTSTTLYSPQYVVGSPDWKTTLSIVNLESTGKATVTLRFIGDDGSQIGTTQVRTIPARGKLWVDAQDFFLSADRLTQGYIEVKSDGAPLSGSVIFGDQQGSKYSAALPLVSTLQTAMVFGQVASGMVGDKPYYTGLALLNPTNMDAQVLVELFDRDGRRVTWDSLTIPANRRKSNLLTEYFPGLTGQDIAAGYIKVTSDRGLASFALFGSMEVLSAVPPQVIP